MKTTHGESHNNITPEYRAWRRMLGRCYNKNNPSYSYYGGRGILVYEPWTTSYNLFLEHVGRKPTEKHSLDRINNNGHYEPGNLRWATKVEQVRNRRNSKIITIDGVSKTVFEWASEVGVSPNSIYLRLKRGWDEKTAVFGKLGD